MSAGGSRRLLAACATVLACAAAACSPLGGGGFGDGTSAPRVGQCYDTPDAVLPDPHDPTPAVSCRRPHTLETYAVLHADHTLDRRRVAALGQRCVHEIRDFLGGAEFQHTAVSVYYFTPTKAQRADGARWVRCDAGVVADTAVGSARRVTGSLRAAFAGGVPRAYRRCLDSPPDPAARQRLVPCTTPHVAELLPSGVDLAGAGRGYPGARALSLRANRRCSALVRQALPEAPRTLVIVPTRAMWRAGTRDAQCWAVAAAGERLNDSEAQTT